MDIKNSEFIFLKSLNEIVNYSLILDEMTTHKKNKYKVRVTLSCRFNNSL